MPEEGIEKMSTAIAPQRAGLLPHLDSYPSAIIVIEDNESTELAISNCDERHILFTNMAYTSVKLEWTPPSDAVTGRRPIYGYRISLSDVTAGEGFKTAIQQTPTNDTSTTIVNLVPGKTYRFHVATLTVESMAIPGASLVSELLVMPPAPYEQAWFFEGSTADRRWNDFDGTDLTGVASGNGGGSQAVGVTSSRPSSERCYTGIQSLKLSVSVGSPGGVYCEVDVKNGRRYVCSARVWHAKANGGTKLALWDLQGGFAYSSAAVQSCEWELLTVELVAGISQSMRIAVLADGKHDGDIFIDAVELRRGGATELELAVDALQEALTQKGQQKLDKFRVKVCGVRGLPIHPDSGNVLHTCGRFVKVVWCDEEVGETKIDSTPMPDWNEEFELQKPKHTDRARLKLDLILEQCSFGVGGGTNEYLGEVTISGDQLLHAPPHQTAIQIMFATEPVAAPLPPPTSLMGSMRVIATSMVASPSASLVTGVGKLLVLIKAYAPQDAKSELGALVSSLGGGMCASADGTLLSQSLAMGRLKAYAMKGSNIRLGEQPQLVKQKSEMIRQRVVQECISQLVFPEVHSDAVDTLINFLNVQSLQSTSVGYQVQRQLQAFVLEFSPVEPLVYCLKHKIGSPASVFHLLVILYRQNQEILHREMLEARSFFRYICKYAAAEKYAQELLIECSRGTRPLDAKLEAMFLKYRHQIPLVSGVWRPDLLQKFAALEEENLRLPVDRALKIETNAADQDDDESVDLKVGNTTLSQRRLWCRRLFVSLLFVIPVSMILAGFAFWASGTSCPQPLGLILFLSGAVFSSLILVGFILVGLGSSITRKKATVLYAALCCLAITHIALLLTLFGLISSAGKNVNCESELTSGATGLAVLDLLQTMLPIVLLLQQVMCKKLHSPLSPSNNKPLLMSRAVPKKVPPAAGLAGTLARKEIPERKSLKRPPPKTKQEPL